MQRQLLLGAVLALLASAFTASPGAAADRTQAEGKAKALVLQLSDLPIGFDIQGGRYVSNDELKQGDPPKDYSKLGRLTGYDVAFSTLAVGDITAVESFASIYKSGAGARDSFVLSLAQARKHGRVKFFPITHGASLGSDAQLYLTTSTGSGTKIDLYVVAWHHGTVFAEVVGAGRSGTVDPNGVVALAKKQEARIEKAVN